MYPSVALPPRNDATPLLYFGQHLNPIVLDTKLAYADFTGAVLSFLHETEGQRVCIISGRKVANLEQFLLRGGRGGGQRI